MRIVNAARLLRLCALSLLLPIGVFAQHQGHPKPSPSPLPTASPAHKHPMPTSSPSPSPSASPGHMHQTASPSTSPSPTAKPGTSHPHEMNSSSPDMTGEMTEMGPLLMMRGEEMFVRVGRSTVNVMPMGRMGSGTSWQPASSQMYMFHKQTDDWLLMFHYNALVGSNSQGGPRGVTKFESANWFMPQATRRV